MHGHGSDVFRCAEQCLTGHHVEAFREPSRVGFTARRDDSVELGSECEMKVRLGCGMRSCSYPHYRPSY